MAVLVRGSRAARAWGLAVGALLSFALGGCAPAAPTAAPSPARTAANTAGLVDIGGGRTIYLECRGAGSPTVLFISGTRGAADEWQTLPADAASETRSTFDAVSAHTRACVYDRPGTLLDSGAPARSAPVTQPTTARQGADDLRAALGAAHEQGPYVVVGLSLGGLIAQQVARSSADVAGLVLLDSANEYLKTTFTPEQWAAWMSVIEASGDAGGAEVPDYEGSIDALQETPGLEGMPVVVMSSDHPWDLQVTPGSSTWPAWVSAQAQLALSLGAEHITKTDSGHGLPLEQPELVAATILDVVDAARPGG